MGENTHRTKKDGTSIIFLPESIRQQYLEESRKAKRLEDVPLEVRKREAQKLLYLTRYE